MGLPERLVQIREQHGYTRKKLCEELGRPYATITKYETGEREPGHSYIIEIAQKFGVTTDYILGVEKSPQPVRYQNTMEAIEKQYGSSTLEAFNLYIQLDIEDRAEIRGTIKQMLKNDKYSIQEESKNA